MGRNDSKMSKLILDTDDLVNLGSKILLTSIIRQSPIPSIFSRHPLEYEIYPFHLAVWTRNPNLISTLINAIHQSGQSIDPFINRRTDKHWTPFRIAIYNGDIEMMDVLEPYISLDASVDRMNIFHLAIDAQRLLENQVIDDQCIHWILQRRPQFLNAPSEGDTPLHRAIYDAPIAGESIVKMLIRVGASLEITDSMGLTPFESAEDCLRPLLAACSDRLLDREECHLTEMKVIQLRYEVYFSISLLERCLELIY